MLCFFTNKKDSESSKIVNIFIHATFSWEMIFVIISVDCVLSQRPLCGTLIRLPWPLFLVFPYSRWGMIVLRRSLHGVGSDGHIFGLFVPLPPTVLIGFPQEANISLDAAVGQIVFLNALFIVFHSRYQSTLNPVPPSIRPLWLQGLSPHTLFLGSKCWVLPRPIHPMWNQGPYWKGWC